MNARKEMRRHIVLAIVVAVCGVSLMGLVYIINNKPYIPINPGIVTAPSPVAEPARPSVERSIIVSRATQHQSYVPMTQYDVMASSTAMPSYHGLYTTSSAQVQHVGGGYGGGIGMVQQTSSSRGISYSGGTMPITTFLSMASAREVSQPGAKEAPMMAHVAGGPRHAPGPPNPGGGELPGDHQLVEHPIGDALIPLMLMALLYIIKKTRKRGSFCIRSGRLHLPGS